MKNTIMLEYAENQFVEMEIGDSVKSIGNGLGGKKIEQIAYKVFDKQLESIVSFINSTGKRISDDLTDTKIDEFSITAGIALGAEGNFIIANTTSEVNLSLTITFKGRE